MRQGELLKKFPLEPLKTFGEKDIDTDGMFAKTSRMLFALTGRGHSRMTRDPHPITRQIGIYRGVVCVWILLIHHFVVDE